MSSYQVANLLDKLKQADSDYRFMAICDLNNELEKESFVFESQAESKIIQAVINTLNDTNSEVQNMAIKCLIPLSKKITLLSQAVDFLLKLINTDNDSKRDVGALSLKVLITNIETNHAELTKCIKLIIPKLLEIIEKSFNNENLDLIEIISEILILFRDLINTSSSNESMIISIRNCFISLISNSTRQVVCKKSIIVLNNLLLISSLNIFTESVSLLMVQLSLASGCNDTGLVPNPMDLGNTHKICTILACFGSLACKQSIRMKPYMSFLINLCLSCCTKPNPDELKDQALISLEIFIKYKSIDKNDAVLVKILNQAMGLLCYDPNYILDDEMMDAGTSDQQDEFMQNDSQSEDYSDHDDISWKVRRSAVRLVVTIITTFSAWTFFFDNVADGIVGRFEKERIQVVRVDCLNAFMSVLECIKIDSAANNDTNSNTKRKNMMDHGQVETERGLCLESNEAPIQLLAAKVPVIMGPVSKIIKRGLLVSSDKATVMAGLLVLKAIITTGALVSEPSLETLTKIVIDCLSVDGVYGSSIDTNVKFEALDLVKCIVKHQQEHRHVCNFVGAISTTIVSLTREKFYKVRADALEVIGLISSVSRKDALVMEQCYQAVIDVVSGGELESEVVENGILALGRILGSGFEVLGREKLDQALDLLYEMVMSDSTRLVVVSALYGILSPMPMSMAMPMDYVNGVKWAKFIKPVRMNMSKSRRQTVLRFLELLILLVGGKYQSIQVEINDRVEILKDIENAMLPLNVETDMQVLPSTFDLLAAVLTPPFIKNPEISGLIKTGIIPKMLEIVTRHSHLVTGGRGLVSLLCVWKLFVKQEQETGIYEAGILELIKMACHNEGLEQQQEENQQVNHKEAFSVMSKCVATGSTSVRITELVALLVGNISKMDGEENTLIFSLLCLGELGREIDLDLFDSGLLRSLSSLISTSNDDVKNSAAICLGNVAVSGSVYLPVIMTNIRENRNRYHHILAVNEMVSRTILMGGRQEQLSSFACDLWDLLFTLDGSGGSEEEGTRSLASDCIGKLVLVWALKSGRQEKFLKKLESDNVIVRGLALAAFRYALTHADMETQAKMQGLFQVCVGFLGDERVPAKKGALMVLHAALHSKSNLMDRVWAQMPLLYKETSFKPELVSIVQMGPFQHKVDNGLDNRKIAFDCMSLILDHPWRNIQANEFLDTIVQGLYDPSFEINIACHALIIKFKETIAYYPLDYNVFLEGLSLAVRVKTKETAVKMDIENNRCLMVSAINTIVGLFFVKGAMMSLSEGWTLLVNEIKADPILKVTYYEMGGL